ncbi:hypothetical protein [Guptibacillus sedimenti]|uniref:hypothetical protein n=1 Tax=Guptibacillus sedimenti TaxID=3025680 RepID=UPI00235E5CD9|nr:hypothetical protein [Pseudalkalibacillus sedimenti]
MKRHFFPVIFILFTVLLLVSCSDDLNVPTVEDNTAEQEGRLSRDDAEVLIYHQLTSEEQQTYTVDYVKEAQSLYYIKVYDRQQKVIKTFTVNSQTEEVNQMD